MTPDEENRPRSAVRFALAVTAAWHRGERHLMAREMSRAAEAIVEAGRARVAVPRLPSVVEFCGNELKICGNTFGILRPSI
jgi:hypothetical protein